MSKMSSAFDWLGAVQKAVRFAYQKESEGRQFFEQYRLLSRAQTPFAVIGSIATGGALLAATTLFAAPAVVPALSLAAWSTVAVGGLRAAVKVGSERKRIGKILSDEFRRHGWRTPRNLYDKKSYEAVKELCNLIDHRVEQQMKHPVVRSDGVVPDLEKVRAQEPRTYTRTPPVVGPEVNSSISSPTRKPKP